MSTPLEQLAIAVVLAKTEARPAIIQVRELDRYFVGAEKQEAHIVSEARRLAAEYPAVQAALEAYEAAATP